MNGIRLQIVLAKAGVASRRHAEELIKKGLVSVNGTVVTRMGERINPLTDEVAVQGQTLKAQETPAYLFLNKPRGFVTTAQDPDGRQTVFDLIGDVGLRLFSVGRLDFNTEGALLLTNDGELANKLMHPSHGVSKVYQAKFRGALDRDQLRRLREGVVLPPLRDAPESSEGHKKPFYPQARPNKPAVERSAPCSIQVLQETQTNTWLQITLHEGKNRQIHRMAAAVGSSLLKLVRVAYAGLEVKDLPVGAFRALTEGEIDVLRTEGNLLPFDGRLRKASVAEQARLGELARRRPPPDLPEQRAGRRARSQEDRPRRPQRSDRPPQRPQRSDGPPQRPQRSESPRRPAANSGKLRHKETATWRSERPR